MPFKANQNKTGTRDFFAGHPVFSLSEATNALCPPGGRRGTVERLKHHLEKGRLKLVAREIYAVVPPHIEPAQFHPDLFLTAVAAREDAVFSHHSALELLGAAHSVWNQVTLYTGKRRRLLRLNGNVLRFLEHPGAMRSIADRDFGTRRIERRGKLLRATGPERTLVEGFRRPALAGGLEELVLSAGGFSTLDLDLLAEVLDRYDIANLWAATGWFLERFRAAFYVSDEFLARMERRRPRSPQYLERSHRGGWLASRWNLILPDSLKPTGGAGEP
jgi:predicted transcriptional regulator of viral defense system